MGEAVDRPEGLAPCAVHGLAGAQCLGVLQRALPDGRLETIIAWRCMRCQRRYTTREVAVRADAQAAPLEVRPGGTQRVEPIPVERLKD